MDLKKTVCRPILNRQAATEPDSELPSTGHIMISYNKFSRDICLKIKQELDVSIYCGTLD